MRAEFLIFFFFFFFFFFFHEEIQCNGFSKLATKHNKHASEWLLLLPLSNSAQLILIVIGIVCPFSICL